MISIKSKVGPKGQAVIPKPVRDQAGIHEGDEIYFTIENEKIIVEKKDGRAVLKELLALLPKRKAPRKIDWDKEHYSQFG